MTATTVETTKVAPADNVILVLNSWLDVNKRFLVDDTGLADSNIFFVFDDNTEVHASCSFTLNNRMFIVGGEYDRRQINQVKNCQLKRLGHLPFDCFYGACAATADHVYMCFDFDNSKTCHQTSDSSLGAYDPIQSALFPYQTTRMAHIVHY